MKLFPAVDLHGAVVAHLKAKVQQPVWAMCRETVAWGQGREKEAPTYKFTVRRI